MGIRSTLIESYLTDRKQRIKVGNCQVTVMTLNVVPQGNVFVQEHGLITVTTESS